jgi:hypothetical protein
MFELKIDDTKLRPYVKSIVDEVLRGYGLSPVVEVPEDTTADPENFFVSSQKAADLLRQLQAPDPDAGARREPHWRLSAIRVGDRVFFRDAATRAIIGYGFARCSRQGPHPWTDPSDGIVPAVIVDIERGVRFEHSIPDAAFRDLFYYHGGNRPDFCLFQADGRYARKTYVYPLARELAAELMRIGADGLGTAAANQCVPK